MADSDNKNQANNVMMVGAKIKVFGIGGAGLNAVNNMIRGGLEGVEFYAANTDAQALASSIAPNRIQLGSEITRGLGAGADPDIGEASAKESADEIRKALMGADMVFITAGMGGGTGTRGAGVVADIAKELGCLTVGVVTKPFQFEGKRRMRNAELGIAELKNSVDTLIIIPNQRLLTISGRNTTLLDTFKRADDVLFQAVKGISDLIVFEGLVNVDFADVRAVMSEMGMAMMGTGTGAGENRAIEAAEKAISSPLLEDISIHGAKGVLINVTASPDVTLQEVNEAAELIHAEAHENANIIWGMVIDDTLDNQVTVTVIATGFGDEATLGGDERQPGSSLRGLGQQSSFSANLGQKSGGLGAKSSIFGGNKPGVNVKPSSNAYQGSVKKKKLTLLNEDGQSNYEIPQFLRKQVE